MGMHFNYTCPLAVSITLSVMESHSAGLPDDWPEPSRCWVDTNSVSPVPNRFLRLQSTMLSRLLWRSLSFISINLCLHLITPGHWPDLISTPSEMRCNDTIQFIINMHFMCKYGCTNEYLPVSIFMFIHLIVILSILNNVYTKLSDRTVSMLGPYRQR